MPRSLSLVILAALAVGGVGCVTLHGPTGGSWSTAAAGPVPTSPPDGISGTALGMPPPVPAQQDASSIGRLIELRDARHREGATIDTPIGVGDIVEVSVPGMQELALRTARVNGDGTIALPFVGTVAAGGRTEEAIRQDIQARLRRVMYDPQVSVFVREYRSRQVAVLGSVGRPGTYTLTSSSDTILDLIATARGITDRGARQVVFIPRESGTWGTVPEDLPTGSSDPNALGELFRNVDPIVLNLRDMTADVTELVMSLPVRPGDVIIIPGAGKVFLQGWVLKPGPYEISRDLTMLGVVAAAGGPAFPADMSAARLIRAGANGEKELYDVNLQAIARGEQPDVFVQNGDVIELGATRPRLIAYGLYYFFASVFRVGAAVSVL